MLVVQKEIHLSTRGLCDVRDITSEVARIVAESKIQTGVVNISGVGSTLGITTLEFEPGCVADLERALEQIAPSNTNYAHNARWGDENGFAHLRSALMGTARVIRSPEAASRSEPGNKSFYAISMTGREAARFWLP